MTPTETARADGPAQDLNARIAHDQPIAPLWWLWLPIVVFVLLALAPNLDKAWYDTWVLDERRGILEAAQFLTAITGFFVALRILVLRSLRQRPLYYGWVLLAALACFYIAGEEASWGQHYVGWSTPETWAEVNDQGETNLHNTSSWLDQKPRSLLEIAVILGGIVLPLIGRFRPTWLAPIARRPGLALLLPPAICFPSAVIAEGVRMFERLCETLGLRSDLLGRASEVQELFFYIFILLYLLVLRHRLGESADRTARPSSAHR